MTTAGTTPDLSWDSQLGGMAQIADLEAERDAELVRWLVGGTERVVVDLGCGVGAMSAALLSALPSGSRVVAVDGEPALLAAARRRCGSDQRLEVVHADLSAGIPAAVESADLIWAGAVVHHLPDQQRALDDIAGRLAPGGRLALGEGGLSSRSLPWDLGVGDPGLERRLDAARERWFTHMRRDLPGVVAMPYGWPGALRRAGLVDVTSKSFLLDLPAPLSQGHAAHVIGGLRHFLDHESLATQLTSDDRRLLRRLVAPEAAVTYVSAEDMFLLSARTVHVGRRP